MERCRFMKVHERVARIRAAKNISRTQLARLLRTNRRHVWRIETGRLRLLAEDVPGYARALKVSVGEIFGA